MLVLKGKCKFNTRSKIGGCSHEHLHQGRFVLFIVTNLVYNNVHSELHTLLNSEECTLEAFTRNLTSIKLSTLSLLFFVQN